MFITPDKAQELGSANLQPDDLVFPHRGSIGEVGIVPRNSDRYVLSSSLMKLQCDTAKALPLFIYYFFKSASGRAELLKNTSQVGTPGIGQPLTSLRAICFNLPPIKEQKRIAALLGTIDDHITLLCQTNATLEAIAQALFKSWFVDFDPVRAKMEGREPEGMDEATAALFPSELLESELGLIPKGWKVGCFQACCNRVESGGTPSRTNAGYWNGTISWLTSGEVRGVIVLQTKEKITKLGLNSSSAKLWPVMTTVVAMYGATAGQVCLLAEEMSANQACCALISKAEFQSFVFFAARRAITELADKASGSAQQNLNKSLVANHKIIIPNQQVALFFEYTVSALMNKWISNQRQIENLANIRDSLLPKLISGQLRIPDAEEIMESAG